MHYALYRSGCILLASLFFISSLLKITTFTHVATYMESLGIPFATAAVVLTILVEAIAGLALMLGWHTRAAALILTLLTVAAMFTAHRFWEADASNLQNQLNHFLKNLSIIGGLLIVAAALPNKTSNH